MNRFIETYKGQTFDVLIIGGGITGASIAYEAALRGLSVALVEKNDFASATSSATSKMIHGGLRYLATGQFRLVRESLQERRVLSNIAPNFVHPLPFVFALYDHMHSPKWMMGIGLSLYELLALDHNKVWDKSKKMPHFSSLTAGKILEMFPFVRPQGLKGGFLYYDCRNHSPERLTLAFIKSAVHYGAHVANYAKLERFMWNRQDGKTIIKGGVVKDLLTGKTMEIKARLVINATGPWADLTLSMLSNQKAIKHIRRSEGIHLVLNRRFDGPHVFASQAPDGQHFFIILYRGKTIIGTTDKEFVGDPDNYRVTKVSVDELLDRVNSALVPGQQVTYDDIVYIYGGLRPLVEDSSTDVYTSSRKYEITDEAKAGIHGLISVEGGKFTTSRRLAEKTIDMAFGKLGKKKVPSTSEQKHLVTSRIKDMESYINQKIKQYPMFNPRQVRYLVYSYGSEFDNLMELFRGNESLQTIVNEDGENLAQVVYAIRYEMARTLTDIMLRRTGIGWLGQPDDNIINRIALIAAQELNWTEEEMKKQIARFKQNYSLVKTLKNHNHEQRQHTTA